MSKYLKYLIPLLFVLAVLLGLLQREENRNIVNNQSDEIKLSSDAQKELWGFYQKAQDLSNRSFSAQSKSSAAFLAVGDIMLSRNVAAEIKKANDPLLPFRMMNDVFKSVDFSFGNLESPFAPPKNNYSGAPSEALAKEGSGGIVGGHSMIFSAPRDNIKGLAENKFKILSISNNHTLDQGVEGLKYTLQYLDENSIKHIGAGMTMDEAWKPAVMDINGIKICFFGASYASINDNDKTRNDYVARIEDIEKLKAISKNSKAECDFIAVSMHAGTEYTRKPNQSQIDFAHAAVDAGADIVIGHHPHWVQKIEKYNGKYIFYSLGNFIFDQMWSQETREGLALKIKISKIENQNELQGSRVPASLESIELIPIIIDNYSTPRLSDELETEKILNKIEQAQTRLLP